jgi:hypothetical protein
MALVLPAVALPLPAPLVVQYANAAEAPIATTATAATMAIRFLVLNNFFIAFPFLSPLTSAAGFSRAVCATPCSAHDKNNNCKAN